MVAQIYRSLGSLPEAQALAERSLAERRRVLGPDDPSTAQSRLTLAEARYAKGEVEAAEKELRDALPMLAAAYGADGAETIRAQEDLVAAVDCSTRGKSPCGAGDDAGRRARRAATALRSGQPRDRARALHPARHRCRRPRTTTRRRNVDLPAAARRLSTRSLGPDNPQTAAARYSLAQVARLRRQARRRARSNSGSRSRRRRKSLGDRHPDAGQTLIAARAALRQRAPLPGGGRGVHRGARDLPAARPLRRGDVPAHAGPLADRAGALRRSGGALRGGPRRPARQARRERPAHAHGPRQPRQRLPAPRPAGRRRDAPARGGRRARERSSAPRPTSFGRRSTSWARCCAHAGTPGRGGGTASPRPRDPAQVGRRGESRRSPAPATSSRSISLARGIAASLAEARGLLDAGHRRPEEGRRGPSPPRRHAARERPRGARPGRRSTGRPGARRRGAAVREAPRRGGRPQRRKPAASSRRSAESAEPAAGAAFREGAAP